MKNLILIILILAFWGCSKDEGKFGIAMPPENITFRAIAGGAVMYYKLPAERDINSVNVRYKDAFGNDMLCSGSYASDSLTLYGFNEAQHNVRALVTLCGRNNLESAPTEVFFDTEDSGPVAFFDNVEVLSGWEGFIVTYTAPEDVRGIAHIFYVGDDPLTGEPDTILVKSFPIRAGTETISIRQQQKKQVNDIVIRTEDFRGYMVKQQVWHGIETLESALLKYPAFDFEDPEKLSIEDPQWYLGYEYLFDGNTKGHMFAPETEMRFYTAGPACLDRTLFILDFHDPKIIAAIRFYSMLWVERDFPFEGDPGPAEFPYFSIFDNFYTFPLMLPCNLTVYASNDKNTWIEIGSFEDGAKSTHESRWCYRTVGFEYKFVLEDMSEYDEADPIYIEVAVPPREGFRYLKVIIHKFYDYEEGKGRGYNNLGNYIYLQEVEIYTEKK